jgi:hypothetical protein
VLPLLSVSFIGIVVGVVFAMFARPRTTDGIARALVGSWLGFAAGAIAGGVMGIFTGGGVVGLLGHAAAIAGAVAFAAQSGARADLGRRTDS